MTRARPATVLLRALLLLLLAPALVLTTARLLGPDGTRGVQAVAFTPWALPAYLAVLLLVLAGAVRRRGPGRARLAVGAVALVGAALHAWWLAPSFLGSAPPAADGTAPLTVMTANLLYGSADPTAVVATAVDEGVDVLVLEEVTPEALAAMEDAGLAGLLPHRAGEAQPGVDGTVVLAREPVEDVERLPTSMGSWSVRVGDLRLVAVHPAYPLSTAQWRREHAALREAVADLRPDLVVGDFNATLDHEPMRALADLGYRSAAEVADEGWQPTWPSGDRVEVAGLALPPVVTIDHVLVDGSLTALGARTVELEGTDHRAVLADVARR